MRKKAFGKATLKLSYQRKLFPDPLPHLERSNLGLDGEDRLLSNQIGEWQQETHGWRREGRTEPSDRRSTLCSNPNSSDFPYRNESRNEYAVEKKGDREREREREQHKTVDHLILKNKLEINETVAVPSVLYHFTGQYGESPDSFAGKTLPSKRRACTLLSMSSGPPKGRISQKRAEKDTKVSSSGSPKGSLAGYLVKSPDVSTPSDVSKVPSGRLGTVKRNLALEIGLSSDISENPLWLRNLRENRRPMKSIVRLKQFYLVKKRVLVEAIKLEAPSAVEVVADPGGANLELKKFTNDFLSLYCSDLPSVLPVADDVKVKKRIGGTFLLSPCSKKQCIVDNSDIGSDVQKSASKGDCPEMNVNIIKSMQESKCNAGKGFDYIINARVNFKKRSETPDLNSIKSVFATNSSSTETPKSVSRSSIFSPGEDFWNEAIEVADGLFVPAEMPSECSQVLRQVTSRKSFEKGKSSCAASSQIFRKLEAGKLLAENGIEIVSTKPNEKSIEELKMSSDEIQQPEASPLPIKHFDFLQEENKIINKNRVLDDAEAVTNSGVCLVDANSINSEHLANEGFEKEGRCKVNDVDLPANDKDTVGVSSTVHSRLRAGELSTTLISQVYYKECNRSHIGANSPACNKETGTPSNSIPLKDHLQLSSWLPSELVGVECLLVDGVLERRNLVYCASTSAGKSFVAEILMLRRVINTRKMALLVLPYVSICAEKAEHLEQLLGPLGKHVHSFYGNQGGASLPRDTTVAVCTIEKANSLINKLLEEGRLSEVGIIVIDELHMVGDHHRGYLLELLLTKLRYAAGEGNLETSSEEGSGTSSGKTDAACGLQIVGMSATMPNLAAVADWLQAALYQTDFRPVPLEEFIKVGNTIFNKKNEIIRVLQKAAELGGKDPDHIVELCNEVIQDGHSVLLFCSSRKGCELTARHISKLLKGYNFAMREVDSDFGDASSAMDALRRSPSGLDPILEETLPCGVAYHHAGLTVEEREIIEMCYRKGIVRVLTATSTLAAGVNLPARRVIFRQPRIGRDFIDGTRYRQMSGRAGRSGIDTQGESILICKHDEVKKVAAILNDSCPPLQSCLSEDKNGMTHAIMEVVAGGIVQSARDIHRYVRCTLLNSTKPFEDVVKSAQDSLRWLCHKKFLEWNEETRLYSSTPLGRAAFGSSLNPEESLVVLSDLSRAREGFVLASDLHLVYLVTPINVEVEPDWELYYQRFMELSSLDQSVGNRVGVMEPFLMRMAHGAPMHVLGRSKGRHLHSNDKVHERIASNGSDLLSNEQTLRICRRFYVALMLSRLVQEVPVADVCEAFKVARGMIQALQENAGRFASMVSSFCERLGSRARALYKAGLRSPLSIAEASVSDIANALFDSSTWAGQEGSARRRIQMGVAKKIKDAARKIMLDKAEEARVAAFSAFRSLGVHVPEFTRPTISAKAKNSPQDGTSASPRDAQSPAESSAFEYTKALCSSEAGENAKWSAETEMEKFTSKTDTAVGKADLSGNVQYDQNPPMPELRDETSLVKCNYPDQLHENYVKPVDESFPSLAHDNDDYPIKHAPEHRERNQGLRETINANSNNGPTCASRFPGGFDSFLEQWDLKKEFYFDLHYSKLPGQQYSVQFEVFGLAICWENSPVYYINFLKDLLPSGKEICHSETSERVVSCEMWSSTKSRWKILGKIMSRIGSHKITWNLKTQIQALKAPCVSIPRFTRLGLNPNAVTDTELFGGSYILLPPIFIHDGIDLRVMAWSLWPDEESKSTPSLEKLVKKRLSSQATAAAVRDGRWRNQMHKAALNGCCRRVAQTRAVSSVLWKLLASENLVNALRRIENPMVEVLADMELWGIGVDMEACLRARHDLTKKLKDLEKDAHDLAGMPFSLYSTADIAHVLYNRLKLPIPNGGKKGKLHPSTNKQMLGLLRGQHPIISVIKEHRTLAKLLNSTLGSICSRARLCDDSQKYVVHAHWLQTSTSTGRLSMEEPNLQCVEHMVSFITHHPDARNLSSSTIDHQINPRDFIVPTQDNWLLLTADYSQIELRLMAHFAKDTALIELLSKPDGDCFNMIAARWTECSTSEAVEKIQSFKESFPGVSAWLNEAVDSCCNKGYVETLMGRKRFLSKIHFGNSKEKAKAQRQAVNSICQGSAADVIKTAMIKIHTSLVGGGGAFGASSRAAMQFSILRGHCRIILQVHDELVLEVDPRLTREASILLKTSMEGAVSLLEEPGAHLSLSYWNPEHIHEHTTERLIKISLLDAILSAIFPQLNKKFRIEHADVKQNANIAVIFFSDSLYVAREKKRGMGSVESLGALTQFSFWGQFTGCC
ncbi:hypothetical protein HPP92_002534 [Vanilla planifolia]|uniref:DNA-directed DNA polymerase n=1 Tax=Vanilla planifolia TaxID=51239 RepID=A0A835VKP1_VANPL|nr:hypothetical protein HPP92_002534 [Vanilla planifolia]